VVGLLGSIAAGLVAGYGWQVTEAHVLGCCLVRLHLCRPFLNPQKSPFPFLSQRELQLADPSLGRLFSLCRLPALPLQNCGPLELGLQQSLLVGQLSQFQFFGVPFLNFGELLPRPVFPNLPGNFFLSGLLQSQG
jgi:hypothetical protein